MGRDPWNATDNPRKSLYVAVVILIRDAPRESLDPRMATKSLDMLLPWLQEERLERLADHIDSYHTQPICERCLMPALALYSYKGESLCGSCRGHLAAMERWGPKRHRREP